MAAPITRTIGRIPTEVALDGRHGLSAPCVKSDGEICRALSALADR